MGRVVSKSEHKIQGEVRVGRPVRRGEQMPARVKTRQDDRLAKIASVKEKTSKS